MELRYGRQVRFYDMQPSSSHRIIGIPLIQTTAQKTRLYALDTIVRYANRVTLFGVRYKPYWIMSDLATFSALVYAWAFSRRFPQVSGVGLGLAVLVALLVYKLVLEVKAALGKSAARSFLQDCLLIIIPSFIAVSILLHQPMNLAFSFVGTLLPLYGCFARLGCFLAGCCYGKPSGRGILYPGAIFDASGSSCRRYSPSPNPGIRVFPIQLVEAGVQATLFAALAIFVWHVQGMAWSIFWLYLSLYAMVRFVLDFFRTTSARPRYWRFSEAQVVCIAVQAVSLSVQPSVDRGSAASVPLEDGIRTADGSDERRSSRMAHDGARNRYLFCGNATIFTSSSVPA